MSHLPFDKIYDAFLYNHLCIYRFYMHFCIFEYSLVYIISSCAHNRITYDFGVYCLAVNENVNINHL